ncbi:MAG TPA: zinc dependent phospholipase C family protein [Spirochaetales bacterium]|nr:zinc dependent phospholipase C family protein [Spirochaetales bacterium]
MASQITHALAGEAALDAASKASALPAPGSELGAFFRLGCQGPDLFYHGQRSRPVSISLGTLVHRRGFGRLARELVADALRAPEPAWGAFVLGFLTHAAVDRWSHPFIVWFSGWHDPSRPETARYLGCHAFLERALDAALLERRLAIEPRGWSIAERLLPPGGVPRHFAVRLAAALRGAYPERLASDELLERRVANAFIDSEGFYRFTDPAAVSLSEAALAPWASLDPEAGRRAVAVLYPEGGLGDLDIANRRRLPWAHPCDPARVDARDWFQLVEAAEEEAAGILALALEAVEAARSGAPERELAARLDKLEREAGNGTLNVGDSGGKAARPVACAPLPLPELMEAEFRVRRERVRA